MRTTSKENDVFEPVKGLFKSGKKWMHPGADTPAGQAGDYYSLPQQQLDHVGYDELCISAPTDTYVMKSFGDQAFTDVLEEGLTPNQQEYRDQGCVIKRDFIPESICDEYLALRESLALGDRQFPNNTPYIEHKAVRNLTCYQPLMDLLQELLNCLTGTEPGPPRYTADGQVDRGERGSTFQTRA